MITLKNTAGKPSSSFTMMIVGFIVITLWLLLSIVENLGPLHIRAFSGGEAMAYFSPLALLYFGRRQTDSKQPSNDEQPITESADKSTP